jgi:alpha-L-fucosidase
MISKFHDGRDWFFEKRFGLFLHWGLYAIPAYHEQVLWRKMEPEGVPITEYGKLIHEFDPVQYNPDEWLDSSPVKCC